jgi:hypothetical protein
MTRSIRRGYPYPAHGRAICYSGIHGASDLEWKRWMDAYLDMAGAMARVMLPVLERVSQVVGELGAWYESLSPELKAVITEAAKAQQS